MTTRYPTTTHTRGTTYSRAGLYTLPAGTWQAAATVSTSAGATVQTLNVSLSALTTPDADGHTHALSVLATATETALWPLAALLCDIRFTDASATPVIVPADTVVINVSAHTPPISEADNPLQVITPDLAPVLRGATGPAGPASTIPGPTGPGVPAGGTTGQVLAKASAADQDTAWVDPTGGSGGGTGPAGPAGPAGPTGPAGPAGADGADGADGASAYAIAIAGGFVGTEAAWLASLVGATGATGATGPAGPTGATGATGAAGSNGADGATGPAGPTGPTGPAGADGADGTAADVAASIHAATAKTTLVDADEVGGTDSAASYSLIRTTWANVWAYVKSKADAIYQATLVSGTSIKTVNGSSLLGSGNLSVTADLTAPGPIGGTTPSTVAATSLTVTGGTVTASTPVVNVTQTWNNAAVAFTARVTNVTNTASAAASLIEDWQVGGVSKANVRKDGQLSLTSTLRSLDNSLAIYTTDGLMANFDYRMMFYKNITLSKSAATITGDGTYAAAGNAPLTVQGGNCGSGQDGITSLTLHGGNASPNATTNITGGITILRGGNGSSGSSGAAHGGPVHIAGGLAYGSGVAGDINLAYTGSAARGAVKCWGTLTMDALLLPKPYTTATRPAWVNGGQFFDSDLDKLVIGGASAWEVVTSA